MPMVMVMRRDLALFIQRIAMRTMLMPVVPKFGLLQDEKQHQAQQQRGKQRLRSMTFKRLGQHRHERGGKQRTRRQAQQVLRTNAPTSIHAQKQQHGCQPHAADTGSQGGADDCYQ